MPGSRPTPSSAPGMPRWVKWTVIVVGVLIALFVVLQLTGIGGDHSPDRHGFTHTESSTARW